LLVWLYRATWRRSYTSGLEIFLEGALAIGVKSVDLRMAAPRAIEALEMRNIRNP
jgi:hypothetical protein